MKIKYPRTHHLPMSLGATSDDKTMTCQEMNDSFLGKDVVITMKMDGENTTIYQDGYHARSLDSRYHPSRSRVAALAHRIGYLIPDGYRICGENLQAVHSIEYEQLESFFMMFSVWNGDFCLPWEQVPELATSLGIAHVPVLYQGEFKQCIIDKLIENLDFTKNEGFVVRLSSGFLYRDFSTSVAKFVRKNHVESDEHWMHQEMRENNFQDSSVYAP